MISTLVFILYMLLAVDNHFSALNPMINGTEARPFVYRVLTPLIIRVLVQVTTIPPAVAAVLVMYLSLLGFSWTMLAVLGVFLPGRFARLFGLLAPVGLIPFLIEQRHIYDLPNLFLFTLSFFFLAKDNLRNYALTFILAALSKETSLFLIFFFAIHFRKMKRNRYLRWIAFQVLSYGTIRLALIYLFRDNPGSLAEFHLLEYMQNPVAVFIPLVACIVLIWLSIYRSAGEARFARNALLAVGGSTLLLYFIFNSPNEYRIFLETYPALFLFLAQMIVHSTHTPRQPEVPSFAH